MACPRNALRSLPPCSFPLPACPSGPSIKFDHIGQSTDATNTTPSNHDIPLMVRCGILPTILFGVIVSPSNSFSPPSSVGTITTCDDRSRHGTSNIYHPRSTNLSLLVSLDQNNALSVSTEGNESVSREETKQKQSLHQTTAIEQFISTLQSSLKDKTFISFTLKGPSSPRRKKGGSNNEHVKAQKERLRGKYKLITGRLVQLQDKKKKSNKDGSTNATLYLQATIKFHLATDVAQNWKVVNKNDEVGVGLRKLFATAMGSEYGEDDKASNIISEWGISRAEGRHDTLGILGGELVTAQGIYRLVLQPVRNAGFFKTKEKPSKEYGDLSNTASRGLEHDKEKNVPLPPSSLFFQKLGVTNADGKPVNGMASKLRQCQKFVEIVGKLVENYVTTTSDAKTSVQVIDMGCGRGYLTFSLHSYLCTKYLSLEDAKISSVQTQGIDRRPKLIQEINGIANGLGGSFNSLTFVEGTIGDTEDNLLQNNDLGQNRDIIGSESKCIPLNILIALHACDTATDDAIWFAIHRNADIIVTAPCCQHELRPQIDGHASSLSKQSNNPLHEILRHAIYRERHTEIVTDAMRAMLLEIAGYDTQVFEFIGGEHTAKNVMITAVKRQDSSSDKDRLEEKKRRLAELAQMYGIKRQRLATLMNEDINPNNDKKVKTSTGMPPL